RRRRSRSRGLSLCVGRSSCPASVRPSGVTATLFASAPAREMPPVRDGAPGSNSDPTRWWDNDHPPLGREARRRRARGHLERDENPEEAEAEPPAQEGADNRAERCADERSLADRLRPPEAANESSDHRAEIEAHRECDQHTTDPLSALGLERLS